MGQRFEPRTRRTSILARVEKDLIRGIERPVPTSNPLGWESGVGCAQGEY